MTELDLSNDELLTTTRAVRRRLDTSRPVEPEVIRECLEIALQAPTGSNRQHWHFVVVTDARQRRLLGDLYRSATAEAQGIVSTQGRIQPTDPDRYNATTQRTLDSAHWFFDHIHEAPGMLIPCVTGRPEGQHHMVVAGMLGSVIQAAWSFMLAARARGIGTCWTTVHLAKEREAAELLGIPYDEVTQLALIPFGYTIGTDFKPAPREPLELVTHWDGW